MTINKSPQPVPPNSLKKRINRNKNRVSQHRLIRGAKELFLIGKETEHCYLKPNKKLLVDLITSKAEINKALDVANNIFLALEDFDYRVQLAPKGEFFNRPPLDEREKPDERYRPFSHCHHQIRRLHFVYHFVGAYVPQDASYMS